MMSCSWSLWYQCQYRPYFARNTSSLLLCPSFCWRFWWLKSPGFLLRLPSSQAIPNVFRFHLRRVRRAMQTWTAPRSRRNRRRREGFLILWCESKSRKSRNHGIWMIQLPHHKKGGANFFPFKEGYKNFPTPKWELLELVSCLVSPHCSKAKSSHHLSVNQRWCWIGEPAPKKATKWNLVSEWLKGRNILWQALLGGWNWWNHSSFGIDFEFGAWHLISDGNWNQLHFPIFPYEFSDPHCPVISLLGYWCPGSWFQQCIQVVVKTLDPHDVRLHPFNFRIWFAKLHKTSQKIGSNHFTYFAKRTWWISHWNPVQSASFWDVSSQPPRRWAAAKPSSTWPTPWWAAATWLGKLEMKDPPGSLGSSAAFWNMGGFKNFSNRDTGEAGEAGEAAEANSWNTQGTMSTGKMAIRSIPELSTAN